MLNQIWPWIRHNFIWLPIFIIILTPVYFWAGIKPLGTRFGSGALILLSLSQITALVGMALFAISMILSARLKILDKIFVGMNVVYQKHHSIGLWALFLLLAHPFLQGGMYFFYFSQNLAALYFLPGMGADEIPRSLGIYSLIALAILLLITLFAPFRYQLLRFFHQLLGVAFVLGILHLYYISSDTSQSPALFYYLLALSCLGLTAFVYRTLLWKLFVRRHHYTVLSSEETLGQIIYLEMVPDGKPMKYLPGQFVFISFYDAVYKTLYSQEVHPFSLTSDPHTETLSIASKELGDYTSKLASLRPGAIAKVEGPFGSFSYNTYKNKNQVWIGGGSGIAPFLGMARHLRSLGARGYDYRVDIYYCVKDKDELAFSDEFKKIADGHPGIRYFPYIGQEQGFLTAEKVEEISGNIENKDIFICGPPIMMKSLKKQFVSSGVSVYNIHTEEFQLLK